MQPSRIKPQFQPPADWQPQLFRSNPIFSDLQQLFQPASCHDWPSPTWLNNQRNDTSFEFVANERLEQDGRYYEAYIYATQQIPTRAENYHDFFGGLIWCLFPKTKALLNQLHMQDIQQFGISPRTPLRNKLTLLDECGVIVAYRESQAATINALRQHQWQEAFWQQRATWWQQLQPVVFGHAIYEMATKPFLGLTAKCWFMPMPDAYFSWPLAKQYHYLDEQLCQHLQQPKALFAAEQLTPLPLLGVPGWYDDNQQIEFYNNTDYFRPKRNVSQ
ncbi:MAG: DUF3025 domain-containing protein [Alkalimonas sp.]|nr:DUF3025 domain-containing protein [Alkalimonas sp.]